MGQVTLLVGVLGDSAGSLRLSWPALPAFFLPTAIPLRPVS